MPDDVRIPDVLLARLRVIPTATLCDAVLKMGQFGPERLVMRRLRPLYGLRVRAVGRARTQQLVSLRDRGRGSVVANRALHFELVDHAHPDDFLVVAVAGTDPLASFGDILALKAKAMGVAGVALDGATRDAALIESIELPLWCDGVTMIPQGHGAYSVQSVNEPVTCAGVEVLPGDIVAADADGVIVLPAAGAEEITALAEEIEASEEHARTGIAEGVPLADIYPSRAYYKPGQEDAPSAEERSNR